MGNHGLHQPLAEPVAPILLQDVDVAQIAEGGAIGDDPGETDLTGSEAANDASTMPRGMPLAQYERVRKA